MEHAHAPSVVFLDLQTRAMFSTVHSARQEEARRKPGLFLQLFRKGYFLLPS
jgi:hypothetical protein